MRFPRQTLLVVAGTIALAITVTTVVGQVTTSQYDNMHTGATVNEKTLTPLNVNAREFGKLGAFKVDGAVYAQPLFVPAIEIPGRGKHDVLFVATEHDSVYAFDADRPDDAPLWHVSFLDGKRNLTTVPARDVQCPFIQPEVGITSTPVIDLNTGTLYVLARTMIERAIGTSEYFQHLHALAITTGMEKFGGPQADLRRGARQGRWRCGRPSAVQSPAGQSTCRATAGRQRCIPYLGVIMRC